MSADPRARRGPRAGAVHVAQRVRGRRVLIARGFDARWRFNRNGSPRFRQLGRHPPRQGRARRGRDERPTLLVPLKPSRPTAANAPAASFLIGDDDALEIAWAAQLEIEPPHVGDAAEVAVAGQGGLVGGRQRRPATVTPQTSPAGPKAIFTGSTAAQSRGGTDQALPPPNKWWR